MILVQVDGWPAPDAARQRITQMGCFEQEILLYDSETCQRN